jgi:hypothetical protein
MAHRPGGFRCHVARGNAGSPGCNNQLGYLALLAQCVLNVWLLVWNYQVADHLKSIRAQKVSNGRPRHIYPLPPEAGVAHGNDSGTHQTIVRAVCESRIPIPLETMRE